VGDAWSDDAAKAARLVYILYLVGPLTGGLTIAVGVVLAYVHRGESPAWLFDHFTYQIRMFWLGLLYSALAAVLTVVLVGFLLAALALVWFVVRCVKGYQHLDRGDSPGDVETWLI
jgi:uncharacterized membrane protein